MAKQLTNEERVAGLAWVLYRLDEAAPRYPDLAEIAKRARATQGSLDAFMAEIDQRAIAEGRDKAWKSNVFPAIVTAWMNGAGTASRDLKLEAEQSLKDRRDEIIKTAEALLRLLRRNARHVSTEIGMDLRALPVSIRFPDLMPSLKGLVEWGKRDKARKPRVGRSGAKKVTLFVQRIDRALGFALGPDVVADLWRLLEQEEITANAIRMARSRTNSA